MKHCAVPAGRPQGSPLHFEKTARFFEKILTTAIFSGARDGAGHHPAIPGNSTPEQLAGVMLDVTTPSTILHKPLIYRQFFT